MQLFDLVEPSSTEYIVGIDLGTTNSIISLKTNESLILFKDPKTGSEIIPSVVWYDESNIPLVGQAACLKEGAFRSVKRYMGKEKIDSTRYPLNSACTKFKTLGGYKSAVEISSDILKYLKNIAENELDNTITKVVITVPAYFDEKARQATQEAATVAGLEVIRIINEPTAAAFAYGFHQKKNGIYAVYDLGGGTFDVSILYIDNGVFQVLATVGNIDLGGDDFDLKLLELLCDKYSISFQESLLLECKLIKEHLTENSVWEGAFANIQNIKIERNEFEEAIKTLVIETLHNFKTALKDASIINNNIDGIILVGGATRIPLVRKTLRDFYGKDLLDTLNPDTTVAIGAALQAYNLKSGDTLLIDVTPLSLKIELADGTTQTIIHRNTALPAVKSFEFTTQKDNQQGFVIHVLQGEGERVEQCRSLMRFELKGIKPLPAGEARLTITFKLNADGLLSVKAQEKISNISQELIVNPMHNLTQEAIVDMLKTSSI